MNIAILETMSLDPSPERRIWFCVDELDALGRIQALKDALARLRKFGGCVALGFQSFAQVRQIYGEGARSIIEDCGNLLLLRSGASGDGGTAERCARLVGEREIEREDVSRSRTQAKAASPSTSFQVRRSTDDALLATEFMQLADCEGFLKRALDHYWSR